MKTQGSRLACISLALLVSLLLVSTAHASPGDQVTTDLQAWSTVMEMFRLDDGVYPSASSIDALAAEALRRRYWDAPATKDPFGRDYSAQSSAFSYRISSASGHAVLGTEHNRTSVDKQGEAPPRISVSQPAPPATSSDGAPDAGTNLTVTKSGADVVLTWTGSGTLYDGVRANDARFTDATTVFIDRAGASFTYAAAVNNPRRIEFFDVTDETEPNHGGNWNGGLLPPLPPFIDTAHPATNIGNLFVGSSGTIAGGGFSSIADQNLVCFSGGVCTPATSVSVSQIQFTTPAGALSGNLTVSTGDRVSEPKPATVNLEDAASGWLIRTIGYSAQDTSFWMTGSASANSLYRLFFNTGTNKWTREDRGGAFSGEQTYCSSQTSRSGQLFCGRGGLATNGGISRVVQTSPPGNLSGCILLGAVGDNSNIRGAAADPNPSAVAGRDVAYFAHAIDSATAEYHIKKVAGDCSQILDNDYGNTNWSGNWNSLVGMAVDPISGDLYVAQKTAIYKIVNDSPPVLVKAGFVSINGLSLYRKTGCDPGLLLVADGGTANTVRFIALDNLADTPRTVSSAATLRGLWRVHLRWQLARQQRQPDDARAQQRQLGRDHTAACLPADQALDHRPVSDLDLFTERAGSLAQRPVVRAGVYVPEP